MIKPTRGERNNNPGNIERAPKKPIPWRGMSPDQSGDARFVVFITPYDGIRALARNALNAQRRHGCQTIREIISRWAPANENDLAAYIADVCKKVVHGPDDPILLGVSTTLEKLVRAIIHHENGRVIYDDETIDAAVKAALGVE